MTKPDCSPFCHDRPVIRGGLQIWAMNPQCVLRCCDSGAHTCAADTGDEGGMCPEEPFGKSVMREGFSEELHSHRK